MKGTIFQQGASVVGATKDMLLIQPTGMLSKISG